jgi:NAD(P) transhydrogenase subunit alpha
MIVGVPAETYPCERRVALVPGAASTLVGAGLEVLVEQGAGVNAGFPDVAFVEHGARIAPDRTRLFSLADVILQVHGLGANAEVGRADLELMRTAQVVIGLLDPLGAPEAAQELAETGVTAFALELLPRIARAQPMDALTSMATVAGYKAGLMAAEALPKMCPMMITAAGTISPARVLVVGAGVAGLQAIATCRRLGAVVQAYDVRPAAKAQVESLGAKFLEIEMETGSTETSSGYARAMGEEFYRRQREMMSQAVSESDVVITTAVSPGSKAPILVTDEMVQGMRPGSVILDLAAERGGNCELTRPGERVETHGVTILGPVILPSSIPYHASQMYARNVTAFVQNLVDDGNLRLNSEDQIIRDTLLSHRGEVVSPEVRKLLGLPILAPPMDERAGS